MRDALLFPFFASLSSLQGVGPKMAPLLEKLLGGSRVVDLLMHVPERWLDRRERSNIAELQLNEIATVRAVVESHDSPQRNNLPHRVRLVDDTGFLTLVFFRANSGWIKKQLPVGDSRIVSGRVEDFNGQRQIIHPDHIVDPERDPPPPSVEPVYRLTAGVTNKRLHGFQLAALQTLEWTLPEWIDGELLRRHGWPPLVEALHALHAPKNYNEDALSAARRRLAYDEALVREVRVQRIRLSRERHRAPEIPRNEAEVARLTQSLPFTPTNAQKRAAEDIERDMATPHPMRRMVQGDVGSGKTLVAAYAALQAASSGFQSAVMAPTEVLARQQFGTLKALLSPLGIEVAALTGRDRGPAREGTLLGLADGSIKVAVGTHALFQDKVQFRKLGLIIVDEQHRFGVSDRARLVDKGQGSDGLMPHTLVMSATPIPRTLALAVHGDVDMSILDEKPAGRKPVLTAAKPDTAVEEVMDAVGRAIGRGERAFWICPKVDADDDDASAVHRQAAIEKRFGAPVALVHGRLKAEDKDAALEAFRTGRVSVLVATTVVEVGVDVPEATIMVIERAESFGLAQLHQLRGRVGRGDRPAACLLLYRAPLTDAGRERIETLRRTDDGFEIAEADFKLRGPGDMLGLRQSGLPDFSVLDLTRDGDLIEIARGQAELMSRANTLSSEAGELLLQLFARQSDNDES